MTTCTEFLSLIKQRGAHIAPASGDNQTLMTNANLQQMRIPMLPKFMLELYSQCGGIALDSGYIFGPVPMTRGANYPVPDLVQINRELIGIPAMRDKTLFGRNDLFWFTFNALGVCQMLDNVTLRPMRQYDDAWRGVCDCLIAGKL